MEENKNGQGFWVESNFEPNPNYQPKRKQRKTSDKARFNSVLPMLTTFFPRLSGILSLGSGIASLFGGLGKFLKRGCLILIIGIIVIIALLWGIGTCMGIDDDGHQVKAVADSTVVKTEPVAEPEPIAEPEPEPMEPEPEAPEVEEQQMEEPEVAEPEIAEPEVVEPVKPIEEPKPQQQAKPKPRKRTNTQEPQKKKGTGFRLEKVDHIPTRDNP